MISTTVETMDTSPEEKLEIKHENNQYRIRYKAEFQLNQEPFNFDSSAPKLKILTTVTTMDTTPTEKLEIK